MGGKPIEKETIIIGDDILVTFDRSTAGWIEQSFTTPTTPTGYSYVGCLINTTSGHLFGPTVIHSSNGPYKAKVYNDIVSSSSAAIHIRPVYLANS